MIMYSISHNRGTGINQLPDRWQAHLRMCIAALVKALFF
jgi:hypothetical protein